MSIGRNLTIALYDKGLSARELALKIGVSEAMISKIKSNERNPSIGVAKRIAKELNITVDKLIK
jgi:transcriptional regulator with XRE-family HTH domain